MVGCVWVAVVVVVVVLPPPTPKHHEQCSKQGQGGGAGCEKMGQAMLYLLLATTKVWESEWRAPNRGFRV